MFVRLGLEPTTSCSADQCSPNWANQAAVFLSWWCSLKGPLQCIPETPHDSDGSHEILSDIKPRACSQGMIRIRMYDPQWPHIVVINPFPDRVSQSFDTTWSEWSWIINPVSEHPKGQIPKTLHNRKYGKQPFSIGQSPYGFLGEHSKNKASHTLTTILNAK